MTKIKDAFAFVWELLVDGYDIVIGLIEAFPRTVFWPGLTAVALAVLF